MNVFEIFLSHVSYLGGFKKKKHIFCNYCSLKITCISKYDSFSSACEHFKILDTFCFNMSHLFMSKCEIFSYGVEI